MLTVINFSAKYRIFWCSALFLMAVFLSVPAVWGFEKTIDKTKYITVDEIKPNMKGFALSVYRGTEIEKSPVTVLSVIRNISPGQDRILVVGEDSLMRHTGVVQGCSGSPVYIDGRLAGALSAGWPYSKDPLYQVTPIEEMLRVGSYQPSEGGNKKASAKAAAAFPIDFSAPIDIQQTAKRLFAYYTELKKSASTSFPVMTSLPESVCSAMRANMPVLPFNFVASGIAGGTADMLNGKSLGSQSADEQIFKPGGVLAVPLIMGDIQATGVGTVTEVIGSRVYGFGHSMLGIGPVNLPMAAGYIHTVVSKRDISFKLGTAGEPAGTLVSDESSAVYGIAGKIPRMIPVRITVDRYNDIQRRVYNCRIVDDRIYTPQMLMVAAAGAAAMKGSFPPEHYIRYTGRVSVENFGDISFSNISSGTGVNEMLSEVLSVAGLLINNTYQPVKLKSCEFDIKILPKNIRAVINNVVLSADTVRPGDTVTAYITLEPYMSEKVTFNLSLKIPDDIKPGRYELMICGPYQYSAFLSKAASYKFMATDLPSLITALRNVLDNPRDEIHMILSLPPDGLVVNYKPMPALPPTKALLLQDAKRTVTVQPCLKWVEAKKKIDSIVMDKRIMSITVEK